MKNVQIIDGADNCTYDIYAVSDEHFAEIFPDDTDVEFAEDFVSRVGNERAAEISKSMWQNPVDKKEVVGIHGTLFYELTRKRGYYPTKKEAEAVALAE